MNPLISVCQNQNLFISPFFRLSHGDFHVTDAHVQPTEGLEARNLGLAHILLYPQGFVQEGDSEDKIL